MLVGKKDNNWTYIDRSWSTNCCMKKLLTEGYATVSLINFDGNDQSASHIFAELLESLGCSSASNRHKLFVGNNMDPKFSYFQCPAIDRIYFTTASDPAISDIISEGFQLYLPQSDAMSISIVPGSHSILRWIQDGYNWKGLIQKPCVITVQPGEVLLVLNSVVRKSSPHVCTVGSTVPEITTRYAAVLPLFIVNVSIISQALY